MPAAVRRAAATTLLNESPPAISTTCRSAMSCCSTARARCRCICSSMSMAKAATAARPWSICTAHVRGARARSCGRHELPDFLPLFLEFLRNAAAGKGVRACSRQPAHILAAMAERLRKRAIVLRSGVPRAGRAVGGQAERMTKSPLCWHCPIRTRLDLAALDAAWEDEPVKFGPGAGDGCKDGLIARVRGGLRPAPDMPAATRTTPRQ